MTRTILPPQSTELERAVDQCTPHWGPLADAVEPATVQANAQFQPWLAVQWQVAQFAPYFNTVDELLAEAVPWLMERGNAASLRRVLGWLGYDNVTIDEQGAWLHIDVGQPLQPEELARVAHVVRASLPAHVTFYRVFHGYDVRPIVLDRGPALDAGMLDGYSGVLGQHGVVESFAIRRGRTLPPAPIGQPQRASTAVRMHVARYADVPILDAWRLDSPVITAVSGGRMALNMRTSNTPDAGAGWRVSSRSIARASPWTPPPPVSFATAHSARHAAVPIHPPRHWGGPWGGPWRDHIQRISSTEA